MPTYCYFFLLLCFLFVVNCQFPLLQNKVGYVNNVFVGTEQTNSKYDTIFYGAQNMTHLFEIYFPIRTSQESITILESVNVYRNNILLTMNPNVIVYDSIRIDNFNVTKLQVHVQNDDSSVEYRLEIIPNSQLQTLIFSIGYAQVNHSASSVSSTSSSFSPPLHYSMFINMVVYVLIPVVLGVNGLIALILFFAVEFRKKNKVNPKEKKKKILRNALILLIGIVVIGIGCILLLGSPFYSQAYIYTYDCCDYFQRNMVDDSQNIFTIQENRLLTSLSLQPCDEQLYKSCFFDSRTRLTFSIPLLYILLPVDLICVMIMTAGFWVSTVALFKIIRLIKAQNAFSPGVKFTVQMADQPNHQQVVDNKPNTNTAAMYASLPSPAPPSSTSVATTPNNDNPKSATSNSSTTFDTTSLFNLPPPTI